MTAEELQKQSLALEQAYSVVSTQLVQILLENESLKTKHQELTNTLTTLTT